MILASRGLGTILLGLTVVVAVALIAPDSLGVSRNLTAGFVLAPLVGWALAFFGGRLGELIGLPCPSGVGPAQPTDTEEQGAQYAGY